MQLFNLNVSFVGGGTITGTLDSTTSHDTFSSTADLTYTDGPTTLQLTGINRTFGFVSSPPFVLELTFLTSSFTGPFLLVVPISTQGSLAGFNGGVCTEDAATGNCRGILTSIAVSGSRAFAETGTLTPVVASTATPEPASVALLATGLLGLAGRLRSRRRASQLHE